MNPQHIPDNLFAARLARNRLFEQLFSAGAIAGIAAGLWFAIAPPRIEDVERVERAAGYLLLFGWCGLLLAGRRIFRRMRDHALERRSLLSQVREAEDRFRAMFDHAVEGMFQCDESGRFLAANSALAAMSGYDSADDLAARVADIGRHLFAEPGRFRDFLRRLGRDSVVRGFEAELMRKDGKSIWTRWNARAVRSERGHLLYVEGTVADVTAPWWAERRRALQFAAARAAGEAGGVDEARGLMLRATADILDFDLAVTWNVDGNLLRSAETWHSPRVNAEAFDATVARMAVPRAVGLPGRAWESGEPAWADLALQSPTREVEAAVALGMNAAIAIPLRVQGEIRHVMEFFSARSTQPDPEFMAALAGLGDLLDRKRRDEALRVSEARKAAILDAALDGIVAFDAEGRITDFNAAAEALFGWRKPESVGQVLSDCFTRESLAAAALADFRCETEAARRALLGRRFELAGVRADRTFPLEMSIGRIAVPGTATFTAFLRDVTDRRRAEHDRSELAAVVQFSHDAIVRLTPDGLVASWNAGATEIFGYPAAEMVGRPIHTLVPPDRSDEVPRSLEAALAGTGSGTYETVRLRRDGSQIDVSITDSPVRDERGKVVGISSIARDITGRKRLEQQLLQSQKIEAVGRLAGGVAHDFNNILTAMLGYTDLALEQVGKGHPAAAAITELRHITETASSLPRQLLAFSRRQTLHLRAVDLNRVLENSAALVGRLIGEDIRILRVPSAGLRAAKADPAQIEQVLLNLAVNARDAMPDGGVITFETANASNDQPERIADGTLPPGTWVKLTVSDTGCGMPEAVRRQCFEPFFTTKEPGVGTGLGLSTCYGIVSQSGGHVFVESEEGCGTTFHIYLASTPLGAEPDDAPPQAATPARGGETVLIVEDEETVRGLAAQVLRRAGYRTLEAADVAQAIREIGDTRRNMPDLLLVDLLLPSGSGRQVADAAAERHPGVAVVYMSGYSDEATLGRHGVPPGALFLAKPFTPAQLERAVRAGIDAARTAAR